MEPAFLASFAVTLVAFGLLSRRLERGVVSPPMVFLALGIALGKLGWLESGSGLLDGLTELTLVLVLFTDAARIDLAHLRLEGSLPARLLGIGLPLTVAAGALAAWALLPGLGLWEAVLLGAVLAPTDAALGQAVVSNPLVPVRVRQGLNVESGLNDGIALPVVLIALAFAGATEDGGGLGRWLSFAILQLALGPAAGAAVGYLGGRAVARSIRAGWMNEPFQRLAVLGLSGLAFAAAELVGGNGFIAAFVAGLTLGNTERAVCARVYEFGEAEGQLLTLVVFLIVGGILVPEALPHWDHRVLLYAVASLSAVRMAPVAVSLIRSGLRPETVAFVGWFGPRGLASVLYARIVVGDGLPAAGFLESIVTLTVLLSTFLHGATAYPLARRYGQRLAGTRDGTREEARPVSELPVRIRHARSPVTAAGPRP